MNERQKLIDQINNIADNPGGEKALKYIFNCIGGPVGATYNLFNEADRQELDKKVIELVTNINFDLEKVLNTLRMN
jgi:hypothetical protein